jgi:hypothetical protein
MHVSGLVFLPVTVQLQEQCTSVETLRYSLKKQSHVHLLLHLHLQMENAVVCRRLRRRTVDPFQWTRSNSKGVSLLWWTNRKMLRGKCRHVINSDGVSTPVSHYSKALVAHIRVLHLCAPHDPTCPIINTCEKGSWNSVSLVAREGGSIHNSSSSYCEIRHKHIGPHAIITSSKTIGIRFVTRNI